MRVPFAPTVFLSGEKSYLFYELYLTNFSATPINLVRIEVVDADARKTPPVATLEAEQLGTMLQPIGRTVSDPVKTLTLAGGESSILFVVVTTNRHISFPNRIAHRAVTGNSALEGATVSTHNINLHLLASPLRGGIWRAADAPSNGEDNHHRRGTIVLNGSAVDSRRFAIDWKKVDGEVSFLGDRRNVHSYFSYGQPVFAVADGQVLNATDGLPDNVPGHGDEFHPAVPINFDTIAGNTITLELGDGQFAYYMHLQPGSVRVKAGDHVQKGQLLANIGASGDAREPHLHFEVTTSPHLLLGEGVPYLLEHYRSNSGHDGAFEMHDKELPLNNSLVDFGN
ncbi:M23 family metallopeptidase [soil metagenome]